MSLHTEPGDHYEGSIATTIPILRGRQDAAADQLNIEPLEARADLSGGDSAGNDAYAPACTASVALRAAMSTGSQTGENGGA